MIFLRSAAPKARVPKGAIWLHNDTTPPDGTERFTSADNRLIVGAGDSYEAGDTGGSNSVSLSGNTGSTANHGAGVASTFGHPVDEGAIYSFTKYVGSNDGAHSHDYDSGEFIPAQRKVVMVKATQNLRDFPAKALLMSTAAQNVTENTDFTDKYFQCNSIIENVAESSSIDLAQAGGHNHGAGSGESSDNALFLNNVNSGGSHSGATLTPDSITDAIKKVRLSMWTHATERIKAANNIVVMWETSTPPPGWELFTEAEDCFILPCETGSENTTPAGNNTIDMVLSGTTTHTVAHDHVGSTAPAKTSTNARHTSYSWVHTHSLSTRSGVSYLPRYYALYFIKKI